jgi:hypothetical protein
MSESARAASGPAEWFWMRAQNCGTDVSCLTRFSAFVRPVWMPLSSVHRWRATNRPRVCSIAGPPAVIVGRLDNVRPFPPFLYSQLQPSLNTGRKPGLIHQVEPCTRGTRRCGVRRMTIRARVGGAATEASPRLLCFSPKLRPRPRKDGMQRQMRAICAWVCLGGCAWVGALGCIWRGARHTGS